MFHSCTLSHSSTCNVTDVPKHRHLINLGKLYENVQKRSADNVPDNVLKTVWNETERLNDTNEYLNVVELWLPLSENCLPVSIIQSNDFKIFCNYNFCTLSSNFFNFVRVIDQYFFTLKYYSRMGNRRMVVTVLNFAHRGCVRTFDLK